MHLHDTYKTTALYKYAWREHKADRTTLDDRRGHCMRVRVSSPHPVIIVVRMYVTCLPPSFCFAPFQYVREDIRMCMYEYILYKRVYVPVGKKTIININMKHYIPIRIAHYNYSFVFTPVN